MAAQDIPGTVDHWLSTQPPGANAKTHEVWEFNLRFKIDFSTNGPGPSKPAVVDVGMRGDRVAIVFAAPSELSSFIKQSCQ